MPSTMELRPFANTDTAKYIENQIDLISVRKSQREIALEIGFKTPNLLSMVKRGETKLPLDKIVPLAEAMEVEPGPLLRMALQDYMPTLLNAIDTAFHVPRKNEWRCVLEPWRALNGDEDPSLSPAKCEKLWKFMSELKWESD